MGILDEFKKLPKNYCAHCNKIFENSKQLNNHFNQLGEDYFGAVDREFDDELEKLG